MRYVEHDYSFTEIYSDGILIYLFLPKYQKALDGKLQFCKQHPDQMETTHTLSSVIRPPYALQNAISELVGFKLIKQEGQELWVHREVQEASKKPSCFIYHKK